MLSIFPNLLTYSLFAPFVLRLALGSFFILQGIRRIRQDAPAWNSLWGSDSGSVKMENGAAVPWTLASVLARLQILIGAFIFIGLFTQVVTILAILFVWVEWFKRSRTNPHSFSELWGIIFVTAIGISLLFLGAGYLAFDLPL